MVFATPVCFWKVKVFLDSARWMSESDLGSWLSKSLASFRIVSDDEEKALSLTFLQAEYNESPL
ncbi:hypothetical protein D3C76_1285170 [compost metagenome]